MFEKILITHYNSEISTAEVIKTFFKVTAQRGKVCSASSEYQYKYEQYGDRNRSRVIKEYSRGDGTEGALCTGEFRKGPLQKPLFVPPTLAQDANQF